MIGSHRVEEVIEHPQVRAGALTGSGRAGRAVASKAGSVLKKTMLELGGSDPYLEDARGPNRVRWRATIARRGASAGARQPRQGKYHPGTRLKRSARPWFPELAGNAPTFSVVHEG